jgi:phosphate transport system protein
MEHQRILDKQLTTLQEKILQMGSETQDLVERSVRSLTDRDSELARRAVADDQRVDELEIEIDRLCIELIATQQPVAHDLRFVIAIAKITPILERIADHASSIAESALRINELEPIKTYSDLGQMAQTAGEMLTNALAVITSEDAKIARQIIKQDDLIDEAYKRIFGDLIQLMVEQPAVTAVAAQLLFVAKHLERIGDYVKDICELTVYMKEAVYIKHTPRD